MEREGLKRKEGGAGNIRNWDCKEWRSERMGIWNLSAKAIGVEKKNRMLGSGQAWCQVASLAQSSEYDNILHISKTI